MQSIQLLTTPDTTLSWIFYLLLGLLLVTIAAGAFTGRRPDAKKASSVQRPAQKPARARKGRAPAKKAAR
jgi:hypothetical protein